MCFLKIFSDKKSFKVFAESTSIPVFSVFDKGEYRKKRSEKSFTQNQISIDVSEKDFDEFKGQVTDAITFLQTHFDELSALIKANEVTDAYLDFPLYSRLTSDIVNQNDHLPKELITLAGKLNIGIEMSIYSQEINDES
jgi:hypothetical protein